jgi:hypothetical protein
MAPHMKSQHLKIIKYSLLTVILFMSVVGATALSLNSTELIGGTPAELNAVSLDPNVAIQMTITDNLGKQHVYAPTGQASVQYVDPTLRNSPVMGITGGTWLSYPNGSILSQASVAPVSETWSASGQGTYNGHPLNATEVVYHYVIYYTVSIALRSGPRNTFLGSTYSSSNPFNAIVGIGSGDSSGQVLYHPGMSATNPCYLSPFKGIVSYRDMYQSDGNPNSYLVAHNVGDAFAKPSSLDTLGALTMFNWAATNNYGQGVHDAYQTNTMNAPLVLKYDNHNYDLVGLYLVPKSGYEPSFNGNQAKITSSITPLPNEVTDLSKFPSISTLNAQVAQAASAQPVTVRATLNLVANTQQIRNFNADFPVTLKNGTVVNCKVNTVSAIVGFNGYNGEYTSLGYPAGIQRPTPYSGVVPNTNVLHQIPSYGLEQSSPSWSNAAGNDHKDVSMVNGYLTSATANGYVHVDTTSPEVILLGGSHAIGTPTTTVDNEGRFIDLASVNTNCGMPKTLGITVNNIMGPRLSVWDAQASVKTQMYGEMVDDKTWSKVEHVYQIAWPYAASDTNFCTAQNFTIPVDVISERNVQYFTSTGHYIPISEIIDTDPNAIHNNPHADDLNVTQTGPELHGNWIDQLGQVMLNFWNNLVNVLGIFGACCVAVFLVIAVIFSIYGIVWFIRKILKIFHVGKYK